jgi:hypothetical protein
LRGDGAWGSGEAGAAIAVVAGLRVFGVFEGPRCGVLLLRRGDVLALAVRVAGAERRRVIFGEEDEEEDEEDEEDKAGDDATEGVRRSERATRAGA